MGRDFGETAFEFVTTPAGKTEIVEQSRAVLSFWNNMVKRHRLPGVSLGGMAIGAAPVVGGKESLSQVGSQVAFAHTGFCPLKGICDRVSAGEIW